MMRLLKFLGAPITLLGVLWYMLILVPWSDGKMLGYRKVVELMYGNTKDN